MIEGPQLMASREISPNGGGPECEIRSPPRRIGRRRATLASEGNDANPLGRMFSPHDGDQIRSPAAF
jgi:hypothetical protein